MKKILQNKRGQIGETLTWVIALVIIVVLMIISVYIAGLIATPGSNLAGYSGGKYFAGQSFSDLFARQSLISFLLTQGDSGKIIYENLKSEGDFNNNNGNLAVKIFNTLYLPYYTSGVYLGVSASQKSAQSNKYFTNVPGGPTGGTAWTAPIVYAQSDVGYSINLSNGKYLDLILAGWGK